MDKVMEIQYEVTMYSHPVDPVILSTRFARLRVLWVLRVEYHGY